jgi:hypothetical protein
MKQSLRVCAAVALLVTANACSSTTEPSKQTATFTAQLSPGNEVPPVVNVEFTGSGVATITLEANKDSSGVITSATATFQVTLTGFPNGTSVTGAHIHRGNAGVAGDIVIDTGLNPGEVVLNNGTGSFSKAGVAVTSTIAQEILNGPSGFYFNVHSILNGTGMARGQLVRQ